MNKKHFLTLHKIGFCPVFRESVSQKKKDIQYLFFAKKIIKEILSKVME